MKPRENLMDPRFQRKLRPIAAVVLFFFTWISIEPWNYAVWAQDGKQPSAISGQPSAIPKVKSTAEKFEESLRATKKAVETLDQDVASGKDITLALETLKGHKQSLEAADPEIRAEFTATEKFLKEKDLPQVILDRHAKAVADYDTNYGTLKTNLDSVLSIEAARKQGETKGDRVLADKKRGELKARLKATKDHLTAKVKGPRHQPLDPNNLPHRAAKPTNKKPRLKKEEFKDLVGVNGRSPVLLAYNGDPSGLLVAQTTQDLPTDADLAETIEVQFTQEITDLAASLNHNPVKIYEYVKNNVVFEPYYGSLKGARETLSGQSGNDFDQASLLIALLRKSGIPARYVYGTVEIPIQKVMGWVGVEKEDVAAKVFATAGIPVLGLVSGGKISSVQMEHVWVEAYVSYDNYRGHPRSDGNQWIPLDPSFKQLNSRPGPDLKQMMQFDPQAFLNGLQANSTIDQASPSVTSVSGTYIDQQFQTYQTNLSNAIAATIPNATPQDLVGNYDVLTETLGLLPATLPYKVVVTASRYPVIPDNLRYKLQLSIPGDIFTGAGGLSYQASLAELADKKITLAYQPAGISDETTLKTYGKLSATPAYLVQMKPALMIDGIIQATGGVTGVGKAQTLTMTFTLPGTLGSDQVVSDLTVGSYYAIGLNLQKISRELLTQETNKLTATRTALQSLVTGTPATIATDDLVGDMLYSTAINYFYNSGAAQDLIARTSGLVLLRQPSEAVVFVDLKLTTLFGITASARPTGLSIDVDRNIVTPVSRTGDSSLEKAFLLESGMYSSAMEHVIFERMFNVGSISMARVFQLANAAAIPIYAVSSTNINQVLPLLQVDSAVKTDIQNAIHAGKIVAVPRQNILYNGWQGVGYLVLDPATLAGAYRISGGISGGSTTNNRPNLQSTCTVEGDWDILLKDIDALLAIADILLLGQENLNPLANIYCELVQGMNPNIPEDARKAEIILERFGENVAIMAATTLLLTIPLEATPQGLIAWLITEAAAAAATGHFNTVEEVAQFDAYYILHYLYEYLVLFNVGLLPAFPSQF